MNGAIPRLRFIRGAEWSGKSTLKTVLPRKLLGVYVNPDDIERQLRAERCLNLNSYDLEMSSSRGAGFFQKLAIFE